MVGNDVVDLGDPELLPETRHPRFDARVFGALEREALRMSARPQRLRWVLWAAKEAAYKVARREDPKTVFAPSRFEVCLTRHDRARVQHAGRRFAVLLDDGEGCVHAVATRGDVAPEAVLAAARRLPVGSTVCPGSAARAFAIASVASRLRLDPAELAVVREGRVPRLVRADGSALADLSLSHHGRFVAFACALPAAPVGTGNAA